MKIPEIYRDWRIVFGFALIMLGAGNWVVGWEKTQQYSRIIASDRDKDRDLIDRGFDEIESGPGAVLEPFTTEAQRVSYATARMDFYHATFLTGQVLVLLGLLCTLIGFLHLIRSDARRVIRRISEQPRPFSN